MATIYNIQHAHKDGDVFALVKATHAIICPRQLANSFAKSPAGALSWPSLCATIKGVDDRDT